MQPVDKIAFGKRVTQRRKKMRLSQTKLAALIGMSQQGIRSIEAGHVDRPRKMLELARELDVEQEWLLYGDGDPESVDMPLIEAVEAAADGAEKALNSAPDAAAAGKSPSPPPAPPRTLDDNARELLRDFALGLLHQVAKTNLEHANEFDFVSLAIVAVQRFEDELKMNAHLATMGMRENSSDQKANQATQKRSL